MTVRIDSHAPLRALLRAPAMDKVTVPAASSFPPYRVIAETADIDLTFFIACYNEEDGIIATIATITDAMDEVGLRYEMIVVDDNSRDRSRALVKAHQQKYPHLPLRLIENKRNLGLARNFVEASFLGRGKYYKLVCGDNVTPKETLVELCRHLGKADIIAPYHPVIEGRTLFRTGLSQVYTWLVNSLSGHKLHYYNGCGIYHRADVMRWHSRSHGFGFQAELVTSLLDEGATILQVAVPASDRAKGSSTALKFRNWMSVGHSLLEILLRRLRRAFFS
jgi:glycosyltransferase involved in cell wall biosynthesis